MKLARKLKRIVKKDHRIQILILAIIISTLSIHPRPLAKGEVAIKATSSPIIQAENINTPKQGDIITNINGREIKNMQDYTDFLETIKPGDKITITIKRETLPYYYKTITTYPFIAEEKDNRTNIGLKTKTIPTTNLNYGLEIEGGTTLLLKPTETEKTNLTDLQFQNVIEVLRQRLNIFGLKDVPISGFTDLSGNRFVKAEFAGVGHEEALDLISKEGKFEARIGNKTTFTGEDIIDVCLSGVQCTNIIQPFVAKDPQGQDLVAWKFVFQIDISKKAASAFANITNMLEVGECEAEGVCYLNETIEFYIDDKKIEGSSLRIVEELKGKEIRNPAITGTRTSKTEAQNEKKKLQAILQSRKLPISLEVARANTISPKLGENFAKNTLTLFVLCIILVNVWMFIRYRKLSISLSIILISLSEILLTIGIASMINWTLDFASIAGIIAAVGTGVNDQIIITDEVLRGSKKDVLSDWKKKIQRAFFMIMAAFTVTTVSMLPLLFAGAGLLRGFALTTIIGLCVGVFITRPAYANLIENLLGED